MLITLTDFSFSLFALMFKYSQRSNDVWHESCNWWNAHQGVSRVPVSFDIISNQNVLLFIGPSWTTRYQIKFFRRFVIDCGKHSFLQIKKQINRWYRVFFCVLCATIQTIVATIQWRKVFFLLMNKWKIVDRIHGWTAIE